MNPTRRFFAVALALLLSAVSLSASAQTLTAAQNATLKAAINANPTWAAFPLDTDGYINLSVLLNQQAVPLFTVWRTNVPTAQVGISINSTELAGLTTANTNRLMVMSSYSGGSFDGSKTDVRAGFDSVFAGAGGALTRAGLLITWKRPATSGEKALATGTGTDLAPATMGREGGLTAFDVQLARNS